MELCQADGTLSSDNECKPTDWCLISQCTEHGKYVNGALQNSCKCDHGYKKAYGDKSFETCIQVNECATQGGAEACTNHGAIVCPILLRRRGALHQFGHLQFSIGCQADGTLTAPQLHWRWCWLSALLMWLSPPPSPLSQV